MLAIPTMANQVIVNLLDGRAIKGELISRNDSVLVIKKSDTSRELRITPSGVSDFRIKGEGRFVPVNGIFYPEEYAKANRKQLQQQAETREQRTEVQTGGPIVAMPSYTVTLTPNQIFGEALKTTGAVCLGIGVPCLAAGLATCIAGNVGLSTSSNPIACVQAGEASYYLLGTGAALTIVGIPLYVKGKKIMELNVNFTGNGAGLAMNF